MHESVIILDDVLDEPDRLRAIARQADYPRLDTLTNFPGRNSAQRFDTAHIDQKLMNVLGYGLKPVAGTSHGKFRLTLADDVGRAKVHLDDSHWSAILYLTPDSHAQGGTDYFRHKATGLHDALVSPAHARAQGWKSREEGQRAIDAILDADTNNDAAWEHTMRVPMRYNRLVLMRPWLWHTAGPGFGSSFEDGRLVMLFFYHSVAVQ